MIAISLGESLGALLGVSPLGSLQPVGLNQPGHRLVVDPGLAGSDFIAHTLSADPE